MDKLDKIEVWVEDHLLTIGATLLTVFIVLLGVLITASIIDSGHDDRPDWANDMARQLDEKGGRVMYYGDAVRDYSGATPIYRIDVNIGVKVYANAQGIVLKTSTGITQIPYERVYGIYIEGSA